MNAHEIRCQIAKYSVDPDNEPAMRLAAWYASVLAEMEAATGDRATAREETSHAA